MPITLPALSRRRFLAASAAAAAGLLTAPCSFAADPAVDPDRFALLSDTHIDADPTRVNRNTNMFDNLHRVGTQLSSLETRPAGVLINGDLAHLRGLPSDYASLLKLLTPLRERGLPLHLALGNHDDRKNFWTALSWAQHPVDSVADRHLTVLDAPSATWFVLDSLDQTNKTPGILGDGQLKWLAAELAARKSKPALVMVHHNPDEREKPSGLTDTKPLLDLLLPNKQVKALIFGHTHDWKLTQRDGLHLINLPPTAYPFTDKQPNGWVDCKLAKSGATLQLHCLNSSHPEHQRKVELEWR